MEQLTIYDNETGLFDLYNEAGQAVETDFETPEEATQWAADNNYEIVETFNL